MNERAPGSPRLMSSIWKAVAQPLWKAMRAVSAQATRVTFALLCGLNDAPCHDLAHDRRLALVVKGRNTCLVNCHCAIRQNGDRRLRAFAAGIPESQHCTQRATDGFTTRRDDATRT